MATFRSLAGAGVAGGAIQLFGVTGTGIQWSIVQFLTIKQMNTSSLPGPS